MQFTACSKNPNPNFILITELRFHITLDTKLGYFGDIRYSSQPICWPSTEENKSKTTKAKNTE